MPDSDPVIIESGGTGQPFNYAVGLHGSLFLQELRDNRRFMAVTCPRCGKVYIPPRRVCGAGFCEREEFREDGPQGTRGTFTILRDPLIGSETGGQKPVPYGDGFTPLEGADTLLQHYIDIQDESKLMIGARVAPVFADTRKGTVKDIEYFTIID